MAGFVNDKGGRGNRKSNKPIGKFLRKLSSFGMKYDDMVITNSRAIGITENELGWSQDPNNMMGGRPDEYGLFASLSMSDVSLRKNISIFDKSYINKRLELRQYAVQDEVEEILDTLCDETIVYDDRNRFCEVNVHSDDTMDEEQSEKIQEKIQENFEKLYNYWGFNNDISAWMFFRKFLIDGYLAFEIIYSKDEKQIIGFNELDPSSLTPIIKNGKKGWVQYKGESNKERMLYDSQIIYIAYSHSNIPGRVSYVERLIRSFNLLRLMEQTRIIWAVVNSSYKMKFVIPLGGRITRRGKQSLSKLMNQYRENIDFSMESGEIKVNGNPMLPFTKEYWFPGTAAGEPSMETIGNDGPDLSDTESLKYFRNKLIKVSKIPFTRFDAESPTSYEMSAEGQARDEIKFSRFVNRLRSQFQELIMKPLWLQTCIDYPELAEDDYFKNLIGLEWIKYNYFEELKEMELFQKRIDFIESMKNSLVDMDDEGNEIKYFSSEFLVRKWLKLSVSDRKLNNKLKELEKKRLEGENVDLEDDELDNF